MDNVNPAANLTTQLWLGNFIKADSLSCVRSGQLVEMQFKAVAQVEFSLSSSSVNIQWSHEMDELWEHNKLDISTPDLWPL